MNFQQFLYLGIYSLMMVALKSLKPIAAVYNCYIKIVLWQFTFFYSLWGCMGLRYGLETFKERRMSCFCQE